MFAKTSSGTTLNPPLDKNFKAGFSFELDWSASWTPAGTCPCFNNVFQEEFSFETVVDSPPFSEVVEIELK